MYTFVFLWTPALSPDGQKVPHGMVFSCFMTACMVGSAASGLLLKMYQPHQYMVWVYLVSALSMAVPFMFHLQHRNQAAGQ
jgi:MFS transporter, MFS domain-containing protein family, molybdate-anion transporter